MSALIGVSFPVNSVGVLPDVDPTKPGYLLPKEGEKTQAAAALVNAKVSRPSLQFDGLSQASPQAILEQYRIKHEDKKAHSLFYKPYSFFAATEDSEDVPGDAELAAIERFIAQGDYYQARLHAKELIQHTLEGLRYLQT